MINLFPNELSKLKDNSIVNINPDDSKNNIINDNDNSQCRMIKNNKQEIQLQKLNSKSLSSDEVNDSANLKFQKIASENKVSNKVSSDGIPSNSKEAPKTVNRKGSQKCLKSNSITKKTKNIVSNGVLLTYNENEYNADVRSLKRLVKIVSNLI